MMYGGNPINLTKSKRLGADAVQNKSLDTQKTPREEEPCHTALMPSSHWGHAALRPGWYRSSWSWQKASRRGNRGSARRRSVGRSGGHRSRGRLWGRGGAGHRGRRRRLFLSGCKESSSQSLERASGPIHSLRMYGEKAVHLVGCKRVTCHIKSKLLQHHLGQSNRCWKGND